MLFRSVMMSAQTFHLTLNFPLTCSCSFKRGGAPKELLSAIEGASAGDEEKGIIAQGTFEDQEKAKRNEEEAVRLS